MSVLVERNILLIGDSMADKKKDRLTEVEELLTDVQDLLIKLLDMPKDWQFRSEVARLGGKIHKYLMKYYGRGE